MGGLEEIRGRWEKATPGPWEAVRHDLSLYVEAESGELNPIKLGYVGNHPAAEPFRRTAHAVIAALTGAES